MIRWTTLFLSATVLACAGADTRQDADEVGAPAASPTTALPAERAPATPARGGESGAAASRPASQPQAGPDVEPGVVLFLGTSLTAGYGLDTGEAFPALIQQKIDSAGLAYRVVNAGLSGETSAGGLRRLDWSLQEPIAVLVLELGANDGLRGLPVEAMRANLDSIIVRTKRRYPDAAILIAGMEAPPNLGRRYTDSFARTFPDLARRHEAALIPFLLDGVAAQPGLNQADGIHPTAAGQRIVAASVWRVLAPLLRQGAADPRG